MKMLFWKEWHELRALPLGAAAAVAVLLTGLKVITQWSHDAFPQTETLFFILLGVWLLFAAVAGAGTIAQEIGAGTLQFLSSLPVSRRTVWWVKAGAALGMLLPSMLSSILVWLLLTALWGPSGTQFRSGWEWLPIVGVCLPFLLSVFAVALAVSPFFDRSLSAVVAAVLLAGAVETLFIGVCSRYIGTHGVALLFTLVGLSIPTFAAISYWTFTRGETLRGRRRFAVAGTTAGICLAVAAVLLVVAGAFGAWS